MNYMRISLLMLGMLVSMFTLCTAASLGSGNTINADMAKSKYKPVASADHSSYNEETGLYTLTGNVCIKCQDFTITADTCRVNANTLQVWADGHALITEGELHFTGDALYAEPQLPHQEEVQGRVQQRGQQKHQEGGAGISRGPEGRRQVVVEEAEQKPRQDDVQVAHGLLQGLRGDALGRQHPPAEQKAQKGQKEGDARAAGPVRAVAWERRKVCWSRAPNSRPMSTLTPRQPPWIRA